jgi:hypothetical protein
VTGGRAACALTVMAAAAGLAGGAATSARASDDGAAATAPSATAATAPSATAATAPSATAATADTPFLDGARASLAMPKSWRELPELAAVAMERAAIPAYRARGYGDPSTGVFALVAETLEGSGAPAAAVRALRAQLDAAAGVDIAAFQSDEGRPERAEAQAFFSVAPGPGLPLSGMARLIATGGGGQQRTVSVACFFNLRDAERSRTTCEGLLGRLEVAP